VHATGERRTMRQNIKDLPRAAWILVAGNFINWFASFAIVFLVLYLTKRGYSFAAAGAAVAAYGVGEMITGGVAGHLADRIGRRTTMAISMFASAAATLALYFVQSYWAILLVAFLAGAATEGWRPASRALMTDVVPEGQRVTAFALVRLAGNLGIAVGSVVAGFLADRSFLWVFVTDAATSAAFGLIVLVGLPRGRLTPRAEERERGGYGLILRDRAFVMFLLASAVISFVYFQGQSASLPLHVVRVSHLAPSAFGFLLALNGLLVVLLELPISSITMHRSPRRTIALGFLLVGLGFGLTGGAHSLPALFGTVAIWTLGEMIAAPVGYAYVADIAPDHLRGRYQGLYGFFWGTGSVTGPAIGTWLLAQSVTGFWVLCGVLGCVAALMVLAGRPSGRHVRGHMVVPETEPAILAPVAQDSSVGH
jgi:MFS family permease